MSHPSRRSFLVGAGVAAAATALHPRRNFAQSTSPFRISVINDEIAQDFEHDCHVAAVDFGMSWIEIRSMWGKNATALADADLANAEKILANYNLQVTDIASPLFKTHWPGAPKSQYGGKDDLHLAAETTFKQQDDILQKSIDLAKRFKTQKVRGFDFWRLDDQAPYRAAIDDKLREAAETAAKQSVLLVLENEFECNTATGREAARTLDAVKTPNLALNWDPANAVMRGELDAFPTAWDMLPKDRIHHCHCKNAVKDALAESNGRPSTRDSSIGPLSSARCAKSRLPRSCKPGNPLARSRNPEESTRISWAGMKQALKNSGTL
jgi:sugar phosphate isomerase/epimerase